MKRLSSAFLLAMLSVSMAVPSCSWFEKKVVTVADDVKTCFGPDVKGDLGDIVKGIGTALVCDLASGGNQLPACTVEGLQTIAEEIGPSGKADVQCVVTKLAEVAAGQKVGASPEEVLRTQRAKLYVKATTLALRSPGDATPKTGPTALLRGGPVAGQRAHNPSTGVQFSPPQPFASVDFAIPDPATMRFDSLSSCPSESTYGMVDGRPACLSLGRGGGIHFVGYVTPTAAHWVATNEGSER